MPAGGVMSQRATPSRHNPCGVSMWRTRSTPSRFEYQRQGGLWPFGRQLRNRLAFGEDGDRPARKVVQGHLLGVNPEVLVQRGEDVAHSHPAVGHVAAEP